MSLTLRVFIIVCCLFLLVYVIHMVKHEKLMLRYSLFWLALAVVISVLAVFPRPLFALAELFGFYASSNLVFFAGMLFLLVIALSLASAVSKQAICIKNLTQRIALLEHELESSSDEEASKE